MLRIAEREDVDSIIVGGDLVPHGLPGTKRFGLLQAQGIYLKDVLIPAIRDFKLKKDIQVYLDLANDDFISNRTILKTYAEDHSGSLNLLHMRKHKFANNVDIIGYMAVPPTPFAIKDWEKPDSGEYPYIQGNRIKLKGYISTGGELEETLLDLESDDTIENDLDRISEIVAGPFIFVSHSPPYNTPLDTLFDGGHVGSISIRRFIEKWSKSGELLASLHGHIHESAVKSGSISTILENSLCVNPGQGSGDGAAFQYVICELSDDKGRLLVTINSDQTKI